MNAIVGRIVSQPYHARSLLYTFFGNFFGFEEESLESLSCATKLSSFGGQGDIKSFWAIWLNNVC